MRSAKKRTGAIRKTRRKPEPDFRLPEAVSTSSDSPLQRLYADPNFQLTWDNDVSYHLAMNVIRLRRLREESQAKVATAMGTSQAKVARIEGGDENVTLRTVKRLAAALKGRIRFAIEPEECNFPKMPDWWDCLRYGFTSHRTFALRELRLRENDARSEGNLLGIWTTPIERVARPPVELAASDSRWQIPASVDA
jgi:transcriptional regulator with XRE-family HTH domain